MKYIALSIFSIFILSGCIDTRPSATYYIPNEYVGVVITIFGQPGYPELKKKNGRLEYHFPPDGILITSSEFDSGATFGEKYLWVDELGAVKREFDSPFGATGFIQNNEMKIEYLYLNILPDSERTPEGRSPTDMRNKALKKLQSEPVARLNVANAPSSVFYVG